MKKIFKALSVAVLVLFLAACGGSSTSKDGKYQAAGTIDQKTGWTYFLTFEMKDGKITNVDYNGVNLRDGIKETKNVESEAGRYKLAAGNSGEWHEQSAKIAEYLEKNQNLDAIKFDDDGKSDAIAGATIHYNDVPDLLKAALDAGPVEQGKLKDGIYFKAADKKDDKGFTYTLGYFVNNGVILTAHADAFNFTKVDGKETKQFKTVMSAEGKYNLPENAAGTYAEQAAAVVKYLIDNQTLDVTVDKDGKTDAISGATISVNKWVDLYKELSK